MKKTLISILLLTWYISFPLANNNPAPIFDKNSSKADYEKINLLIKLAEKYFKDSVDKGLQCANEALSLSLKGNSLEQQAKVLNTIAKAYKIKNDNENALKNYFRVLEICKKSKELKYIAQAYNNIGLVYASMGQFDKALDYYQESYKTKIEIRDSTGIGIILNNIANIHFQTGNYENAILYFQKALDILEKLKYYDGIASCLNGCGLISENMANYTSALDYYNKALEIAQKQNNHFQIANLFNNIGNIYSKTKDYNKSIYYYEQALKKRRELDDRKGIAGSLNNIGLIYRTKKEYQKAIEYFIKALAINKEIKNQYEITLNLNAIGKNYFETGQYDKALVFFTQSLKMAEETGNKLMIQQNYNDLSNVFGRQFQYEKALDYYKKSVAIKDTLDNIEIRKKIDELQAKYETEKKEHEIQILAKQNLIQKLQLSKSRTFVIGLAVFIIIIIFSGFLFIRQHRLNIERQSLILEQKLLQQMNPHFIFNSLTSIQSFIFDKDKLLAGKYIADFASLMRLILENSREEFIILEKEISTLKYYLELQKLRYENKFDYSIFVDPSLNIEFDIIPPMLGQPFVENSIKHGIAKKDTKGQIDIRLLKRDKYLIFEIEDNGIGREKSQQLQEVESNKHISLALSITRERLENLNKRNRRKINLEIVDLERNNTPLGTLVRFEIPKT